MIEKILERLEAEKAKGHYDFNSVIGEKNVWQKAIEIVQEVAKEYEDADCIIRSVLLDKLQKWKFANEERGYDTASDLVQEMIDLVKEQQSAPYQKGE